MIKTEQRYLAEYILEIDRRTRKHGKPQGHFDRVPGEGTSVAQVVIIR